MAFKEIQGLEADNATAIGGFNKKLKKDNPTSAEGYYLGSRFVKSSRGEAVLHFLQTSKGNLGVWGKADLNRKLSAVEIGVMIRITYKGTKATPNGEMYAYAVEQDKDNTIEVDTLAVPASASEDDADSDIDAISGDEESYDSEGTEEEDAPFEAPVQSGKTSAQRKAEVEAMLKNGSNKGRSLAKTGTR